MDRETHKITTPVGGIEIELKSWLTGGEKLAMIKEEVSIESMLKEVVVAPSYDELLKLHGKDFDFLISEMTKVANESSWIEEKKD